MKSYFRRRAIVVGGGTCVQLQLNDFEWQEEKEGHTHFAEDLQRKVIMIPIMTSTAAIALWEKHLFKVVVHRYFLKSEI